MKSNSSALHYVEAKGFRLKTRKPSALENEERPELKIDAVKGFLGGMGKKAGNKTRMEQSTDQ
ncbi:MAG: hypothetical protein LBF89_07165 [Bacteroidales bacterium]|jgi:hypothetical protein|nr:hypothetical protein [Bacteroidales bacterium]